MFMSKVDEPLVGDPGVAGLEADDVSVKYNIYIFLDSF